MYGEENDKYEFSESRNGRINMDKRKEENHAVLNRALNIMRKAGHRLIKDISTFKNNWIFLIGKFLKNVEYKK